MTSITEVKKRFAIATAQLAKCDSLRYTVVKNLSMDALEDC